LLEIIHHASDLDRDSCDEMLRIMSIPKHSRIRPLLPRRTRVAHKTGSVKGVVCDVGIVYLENSPFAIAGMVNWCEDSAAAEDIIARISLATYSYFDRIINSNRYGHKF
jgi:beta-lactamase class A